MHQKQHCTSECHHSDQKDELLRKLVPTLEVSLSLCRGFPNTLLVWVEIKNDDERVVPRASLNDIPDVIRVTPAPTADELMVALTPYLTHRSPITKVGDTYVISVHGPFQIEREVYSATLLHALAYAYRQVLNMAYDD